MRLLILFVLLVPCMAVAQDSPGLTPEQLLDLLGPALVGFISKYPFAAKALFWIGAARVVMKPLMSTVTAVTEVTPDTKDNEWLDKLKANKVYKFVVYLLDWSASVKLPKKEEKK